jgi:acid phosphatase
MKAILCFLFFILFAQSINFIAIGDWGSASENNQYSRNQLVLAKQMGVLAQKYNISFVLSLGDNFYESGVKSVDDPLWKIDFRDVYTHPSLQVPWYPVLGNHDWAGNPQAQVDYSKIDKRWKMADKYYTFSIPITKTESALFLMLDTNPIVEEQHYKAQLEWLDDQIKKAHNPWVFVAGHHFITDAKEDLKPMHDHVRPILQQNNITIYFSGHRHTLEYLQDSKHLNLIISGGGSRVDTSTEIKDEVGKAKSIFLKKSLGFIVAELDTDAMRLTYFDETGTELYENMFYPNVR